jgi:hypothetical protein
MQYERDVAAHNDTVVIIERKFNVEERRMIVLYASRRPADLQTGGHCFHLL